MSPPPFEDEGRFVVVRPTLGLSLRAAFVLSELALQPNDRPNSAIDSVTVRVDAFCVFGDDR